MFLKMHRKVTSSLLTRGFLLMMVSFGNRGHHDVVVSSFPIMIMTKPTKTQHILLSNRNRIDDDNPIKSSNVKPLIKSTNKSLIRNNSRVHLGPQSTQSPFPIQRRQLGSTLLVNNLCASLLFSSLPQAIEEAIAATATATADEEGCLNGSLAAEGAIPGAYQNVCMNLDERSYTLKSTNDQINIYQGEAATKMKNKSQLNEPSGTTLTSASVTTTTLAGRTGVALWNSGLLLTRLIDEIEVSTLKQAPSSSRDEKRNEKPLLFNNKTVLELGCGTGFTSIASSKLGANFVYATDGNVEALELAKANLQRNGIYPKNENENDDNNSSSGGEACLLQWGSLDSIDYYGVADVVLGSDLTYNSGSWRSLVDTISSVLKPNGYMLYLTLGHSGFNLSGELNGFLTVVDSAGTLQLVDERNSSWPFPGIGSLESLLTSSLTDCERAIVKSTGGFKILVLRRKQKGKM